MHIIQTVNFTLQQDKLLLTDLNWTVDECDWISIEGINNSGKTSLLDAIYGQHLLCTGQLYVLGYSMLPISKPDLQSLRRKIGYAKQKPNLLKNKTLRANLAMVLNAADRISDQGNDELILQILEALKLKEYLKKEIQELSMSQILLAGIAKALIHKPKLMLLDQILEGLDHSNLSRAIALIQEYRTTERITVISSCIHSSPRNCINYRLENKRLFPID